MTTIELKRYICENNKVEYILNSIGCTHIFYHNNKDFWSAANYNGDNPTAVNVKNNEYLNVKNWTRSKEFDDKSDLITLVQYNKQCSFKNAVKYLHKLLGLEYKWNTQKNIEITKKRNPLAVFEKVSSQYKVNVDDIPVLDEHILDEFLPILHISWLKEGIMPWTAEKFGLLYSFRKKRIIIPLKYWITGELLGTNSRTTIENYKEFDIKKFFITPSYPKSINLFGLYEHYQDIQNAGYVVVYESEKSVLKRDSLGDCTGVALSGHTISDEQVSILIGLNVDIIISLDKDIDTQEVRFVCEKFYGVRKVYYTYDKWNLLGVTDSVADKPDKIFSFMMKHKVMYDYQEHQKYLKEKEL